MAIAPIAWINEDAPELGSHITAERCLREAQDSGFSAIENCAKFPQNYEQQKSLFENYNMRLIGGWYSGNLSVGNVDDEKKRIASQLEMYQKWECPVMVYGERGSSIQTDRNAPLNSRNIFNADDLKRYGDRLTQFGDWLEAQGCPLSFHHHMVTIIQTPEETDFIMENTGDSVGLLWDTGHYYYGGGNPVDVVKKWGHRINYIHCKDVRQSILDTLDWDKDSFVDSVVKGVFTVPGDGCLDFNLIAQTIMDMEYQGWICIEAEQDAHIADPYQYSLQGRLHMTKCLQSVGYTVATH